MRFNIITLLIFFPFSHGSENEGLSPHGVSKQEEYPQQQSELISAMKNQEQYGLLKRETRTRNSKLRHLRKRRDQESWSDVLNSFNLQQGLRQEQNFPLQDQAKINFNDFFKASTTSQTQGGCSAPAVSHNTVVPYGPQINNYYYQNPPNTNNFQNFGNQPSPQTPIVVLVPYPVYYPPQQQTGESKPTVPNQMPPGVSIPPRFAFPSDDLPTFDEIPESAAIPLLPNPDDYYNTPSGISLKPVKPLMPPTIQLPPTRHVSSSSSSRPQQNSSNRRIQNGRPNGRPNVRPNNGRFPTTTTTSTTTLRPLDEETIICSRIIVECCKPELDRKCFEGRGCDDFMFDYPCDSILKATGQLLRSRNK